MKTIICLRCESKAFEKRTPLIPEHARELVERGFKIWVEKSSYRIYSDSAYQSMGCEIVSPGAWIEAPKNTYILGIKELSKDVFPLRHRHIYFAHVFKDQKGSKELLNRFKQGGGKILDLEYLKASNGKRVVTFGYWSGVAGAAVSLLCYTQAKLEKHWAPSISALLEELLSSLHTQKKKPTALLIGHKGRCGRGVKYVLDNLNLKYTAWGKDETQGRVDFSDIFNHDLFFNCVYVSQKITPFITHETLKSNKKLKLINDISCDPNGDYNPLPIYTHITTFNRPIRKIISGKSSIDLIAIDHLPSFLPKESSDDFSKQLTPYLTELDRVFEEGSPWLKAEALYHLKSGDQII